MWACRRIEGWNWRGEAPSVRGGFPQDKSPHMWTHTACGRGSRWCSLLPGGVLIKAKNIRLVPWSHRRCCMRHGRPDRCPSRSTCLAYRTCGEGSWGVTSQGCLPSLGRKALAPLWVPALSTGVADTPGAVTGVTAGGAGETLPQGGGAEVARGAVGDTPGVT